MKINPMDTPLTRREFEYRMNLLEATVRKGKIIISNQCTGVVESLIKVKRMDNGRIDLLTVDEVARLQANMMINLDVFEESKD